MHNKIQDYIVNSKKYSEKVIILHEEELLGTAGTVKRLIKEYHPDNLLVMHGDNYFQDSLVNLVSEFRNLNSTFSGVLGTFITSQPENCGILTINNGRIEKIYEKSKSDHGNIANSAIYLFNQIILKKISELDSESNDLSTHLIPFIIKELKPIPLEGLFIDIGTPENLDKARLHSKID
jgi:mannose-1-phosphate guanylyltransferase